MGDMFKLARYIEFRNTKIETGILDSREFPKTPKFSTMPLDHCLCTTHERVEFTVQAIGVCEADV